MEPEEIMKQGRDYLARIRELEGEHEGAPGSNFKHLARNLVQTFYDIGDRFRTPKESDRETIRRARESLDTYLSLIDDFPEFREAEMRVLEKRYFPVVSGDYIAHAEKFFREG